LFAAAIDRYRALGLYAPDPVLRPAGFDRLAEAMASGGALSRLIPFETCVDNSLAEQVVAEGRETAEGRERLA
jgi:phage tail tube protein FII